MMKVNGVLCFQLLQSPPLVYPLAQKFSSAAKQLLCFVPIVPKQVVLSAPRHLWLDLGEHPTTAKSGWPTLLTDSDDACTQSKVTALPLHRERCIWLGYDGNHCQNTVPLDSRINGVLCFQLLQSPPLVIAQYPTQYPLKKKRIPGHDESKCKSVSFQLRGLIVPSLQGSRYRLTIYVFSSCLHTNLVIETRHFCTYFHHNTPFIRESSGTVF
jgi:hypothetical protein